MRTSTRAAIVLVAASIVTAVACLYEVKPVVCNCVPQAPSGWQGPFWLFAGDAGSQSCADDAAAIVAHLSVAADACGAPTVCNVTETGCDTTAMAIDLYNGDACSGSPTAVPISKTGCSQPVPSSTQMSSWELFAPLASKVDVPSSEIVGAVALGCGSGTGPCDSGVCLPQPSGFSGTPCVSHVGHVPCASPYDNKQTNTDFYGSQSCSWKCAPSAFAVSPAMCQAAFDEFTADSATCDTGYPASLNAGICAIKGAYPYAINIRVSGLDAGVDDASCEVVDASACLPIVVQSDEVTICCQ